MNETIYNKNLQRTVLVVDDEEINRTILGTILSEEFKVIYAENGRQALEKIRENKRALSLVLLDILMPELNGYEVIQRVKEDEELKKLPIIVLTSEKSAEIKALQMGVADFLTKPYDLPEVILARVKHSIALFEGESIIHAAELERLTGLHNRSFFFAYCRQLDERYPDKKMDLLVLNFNRFHVLDEMYGREFSDNVLKNIAQTIKGILGTHLGLACRYDADLFYVYLEPGPDLTYHGFFEQIRQGLSSLLKPSEISLRMGVYQNSNSEVSIEQRFARATRACNTLRDSYDSEFVLYDDEMQEKDMFSARLLNDFERAIKNREFKVSYQPKYNIRGEQPLLCSAEALVSWVHPEFGRVRPDMFIPLFERNGLIQRVDRYVWEEAARQIKKWRDDYGVTVPVSVNVSRVDMYAPDIVDFVQRIVRENGLTPADYMIEVTESAYTDNSKQIVNVVNNFRSLGFKVEMDDFGSGYSSLNMLATLPIDVLKLDMVFIRNITTYDSKEMRMVELVLDIAKYLNVPVVAEGVETQTHYELLKNAGCDIIQGWYFSKPLFPEDFNKLIEKEKARGGIKQ